MVKMESEYIMGGYNGKRISHGWLKWKANISWVVKMESEYLMGG